MARFTTRIQLNGYPTDEDYNGLHDAMRQKGFSRLITGSDGKVYHLPHAEYNRVAEVTLDTVLADARVAAATVSDDYQVLITEGSRQWYGLKEVAQPAAHSK